MNKKQGIIIVTLLALLVLASVLAARLNGNQFYVADSEGGKPAGTFSTNEKKSNKSEYFAEARITKEQANAQTLQNLKIMIDDKNVSKESKLDAENKYKDLSMASNYESKIEMDLKVKGYEDALCSIVDNKATVTVKSKDQLTDKQIREIKDVVMNVSKIKDVEIQVK